MGGTPVHVHVHLHRGQSFAPLVSYTCTGRLGKQSKQAGGIWWVSLNGRQQKKEVER